LLAVIDEGYTEESQADEPRIVEAHDALAATAPTSIDQGPSSRPRAAQTYAPVRSVAHLMTVQRLMTELEQFDPNLRVVTPGFDESDYDDVQTVEPIRLQFSDETESGHCGIHKKDPNGDPAVLINF
jgi:hypothetical protein